MKHIVCVLRWGRGRGRSRASCLENMYTYSSLDDTCFFFLLCFFRVKKCIREIFMKLSGFKKYK